MDIMNKAIYLLVLISLLCGCNNQKQEAQRNNDYSVISSTSQEDDKKFILKGESSFVDDTNLIFISQEEDFGEYLKNDILRMNTLSKCIDTIALQTTNNPFIAMDNCVAYVKDSSLILWNSKDNTTHIHFISPKPLTLIGAGYNNRTKTFLLFNFDYAKNELKLDVINKYKQVIFSKYIPVNEMELEGIEPTVVPFEDTFVFQCQNNLYQLSISTLSLNLISDNCMEFVVADNSILFSYYNQQDNSAKLCKYNLATAERSDLTLPSNREKSNSMHLFRADLNDKNVTLFQSGQMIYQWEDTQWKQIDKLYLFSNESFKVEQLSSDSLCVEFNI